MLELVTTTRRLPMLESPSMFLARRARELGSPEFGEYLTELPDECLPYLDALADAMPWPPGSRPALSEEQARLIQSVSGLEAELRRETNPYVLAAITRQAYTDAFA